MQLCLFLATLAAHMSVIMLCMLRHHPIQTQVSIFGRIMSREKGRGEGARSAYVLIESQSVPCPYKVSVLCVAKM